MTLPYAFTISCGDGQLSHPPPLAPIFPKWIWDSVYKTLRAISTRIALKIIEAQKFHKVQRSRNTANLVHICMLIRVCSLDKVDNFLCKLLICQFMTRCFAPKKLPCVIRLCYFKVLSESSDRTKRRTLGKRWDRLGLPSGIFWFILSQECRVQSKADRPRR